ncbi:MAG TPA: molecular chaperone DnaJ, partial [Thermodesulfobacteriota bacterium]|nr:molecular chaperone DnaJ [Thermodesulfobacteriota bacterium]
YKRLAFEYHPDRNPGDREAEEKFKKINEAYQILSDPNKRARYDSFGHISAEGIFSDIDFESGFSDIFGNLFEEVFNAGGAERSRRGRDLKYSLDLTFEESIEGCEKELRIPRREPCRECGGSGAAKGGEVVCTSCGGRGELRYSQGLFAIKRACPTCGGTGKRITRPCARCGGERYVHSEHQVKVKVPAGISDGVRLRMRGEGDSGYLNGPSGDLFIEIHVEEHPLFRRQEQDLYCTVPIEFVQAALGAEIEIPTPRGKSTIKIPAGTQSGQTFRLKGKGVPKLEGRGQGDLYIQVQIEVPVKLSKKQQMLLEEFARASEEGNAPAVKKFVSRLQEIFNK